MLATDPLDRFRSSDMATVEMLASINTSVYFAISGEIHAMTEKNEERKPVLINIPVSLCEPLDAAVNVLRIPRTFLILRAIARDLSSDLGQEVKETAEYRQAMEAKFGFWKE